HFHLLGGKAGRLGLNENLRWRELREDIVRHPRERENSIDQERDAQGDYDCTAPDREADNAVQHGGTLVLVFICRASSVATRQQFFRKQSLRSLRHHLFSW